MKKVFAIAVAAVLLVGITALAYGAGKGPVPKATGGVETIYPGDGKPYRASFNAHELSPPPAPPNDMMQNGKGQLEIKNIVGALNFYCIVKYVNVDSTNKVACFAAKITSSTDGTYIGEWFYVRVEDGGSPGKGTPGDYIGWDAPSASEAAVSAKVQAMETTLFFTKVTKGNLVVH